MISFDSPWGRTLESFSGRSEESNLITRSGRAGPSECVDFDDGPIGTIPARHFVHLGRARSRQATPLECGNSCLWNAAIHCRSWRWRLTPPSHGASDVFPGMARESGDCLAALQSQIGS